MHYLHRLPFHRAITGAQHLVAVHNLPDGPLQRIRLQLPMQPDHRGDVVQRLLFLKFLQEPQPLLRKR